MAMSGRLNLPFVGCAASANIPTSLTGIRSTPTSPSSARRLISARSSAPARFGRAVCARPRPFSFGHAGAYDHEDDVTYLENDKVRIVDIGDADIVHTDTEKSHANIEAGVRAILAAGAVPVVIGGDHSVNIPCINAFDGQEPFHLVQIDAHLDFVDERHGVRYGHGNPMRRAAEEAYVTGLSQVGIRNVIHRPRRLRGCALDGLRHRLGAPVPQDGGGCDA